MKKILLFIICILTLSCKHPESEESYDSFYSTDTNSSENLTYKVVGVKDGDTYVLLLNDIEINVRLAHINCPEKGQSFGRNAKQFGSDFCFGKEVTLIHNNKKDRYGRLIAEIFIDNVCLNKELIKNGLAWHYKKYSNDEDYANLEIDAREGKIGLWQEENPIDPDVWRKM